MGAKEVVLLSLIVCLPVCTGPGQTNITAKLGRVVIVPCKVPNNYKPFTAVEWRRPDLVPDYYVLVYRDGRIDPINQHQSYKDRVDLQDKEMKDGNVSLILKNVMKNDTGTFHCRAFQGTKNKLISIIYLEVLPPGNKDGVIGNGGNKNGPIGGSVVGVILLAVALLVL